MIAIASWIPYSPQPKRIRKHHVKSAVEHAKLICKDYEKSNECKAAWDYADDMEKAWRKQEDRDKKVAELIWFSDLENREYDV
jgi:hypothetical protein